MVRNVASPADIAEFVNVTSGNNGRALLEASQGLFVRPVHQDDVFPSSNLRSRLYGHPLDPRQLQRGIIESGSIVLDLREKWAYDNNRRAVRATENIPRSDCAGKVYKTLRSSLAKPYLSCPRYRPFQTYRWVIDVKLELHCASQ